MYSNLYNYIRVVQMTIQTEKNHSKRKYSKISLKVTILSFRSVKHWLNQF